jgi:hypothetical protein
MKLTISPLLALPLLLTSCAILDSSPRYSPEVDDALKAAGANRTELREVLDHYRALDSDPRKYEAACFLIGNMEGHGYSTYGLYDEEGNEVEFDALAHANYGEARATFDALEKEHGTLDFKPDHFTPDLEVIGAEFLIGHIERAFEAWRGWPWARDLSFEAFCEYILPYRGSNEPLEDWRTPLMERLAGLAAELDDPTDLPTARKAVGARIGGRIRFRKLFYLHPTDQGFAEMEERGAGRCEDITNMSAYVMRAAAIASAQDYTPYWANRDNNHAWPVTLDENGEGFAKQGNVAAKIYRKTFSQQRENLAFRLEEGEKAPPWLNRRTYRDVTDQYMPTSDLAIVLTGDTPEGARFAYLSVFNGGEWKAIHWGRIVEDRVVISTPRGEHCESLDPTARFDRMGRGIAYLPTYYHDGELLPAASPFFLAKDGGITHFAKGSGTPITGELSGKEGQEYELFFWKDGWQSLGRGTGGGAPMRFEDLPPGALYWLVADGSRKLERIFSLDADGKPRFM